MEEHSHFTEHQKAPSKQPTATAIAIPIYTSPPQPQDPTPTSTPTLSSQSSSSTETIPQSPDTNTNPNTSNARAPNDPAFTDGIGKARTGSWGACLGSKDGGDGGDGRHVRWKGCGCLQEKMREVGGSEVDR